MFLNVDPNYRAPLTLIRPNSTASILRFNALSAFSIFGKKNKSTTKLKSISTVREELNDVDNIFYKEKIGDITKLTGKQLTDFMNTYRPSILILKKMTGYKLNIYIKSIFLNLRNYKLIRLNVALNFCYISCGRNSKNGMPYCKIKNIVD